MEICLRTPAWRGSTRGDDLGLVTGTSLDKGAELDALVKLPKDERKGLIDRERRRACCRCAQQLNFYQLLFVLLCDLTFAPPTTCAFGGFSGVRLAQPPLGFLPSLQSTPFNGTPAKAPCKLKT